MKEPVEDTDYVISTPEWRQRTRLCDVNLLKPYFELHTSSSLAAKVSPPDVEEETDGF